MNIPLVLVVDRVLRDAGIPLDGVSIGTPADRGTWVVAYTGGATPAQIAAGNALLLTLDPADPTTIAAIKNDLAIALNSEILQALAMAVWEAIPAPTMTKLQLRNRIIAIYKTL